MPRYCNPSPDPDEELRAYRTVRDGKVRLVAEFPFIPDFRAELAWSHFYLGSRLDHWLVRARRFRHWIWLSFGLWFNIEVWGSVVRTLLSWNH